MWPSVFGGEDEGGVAAVGLGDDPDLFTLSGRVRGQQPPAVSQGDLVLLVVVAVHLAPVPADMAAEEVAWGMPGRAEGVERSGCGADLAQLYPRYDELTTIGHSPGDGPGGEGWVWSPAVAKAQPERPVDRR